MTQKELVDQFCEFRGKCTTDDVVALNFAYEMLMKSQWISVEDKLPPKKSEYDNLSNNVLATDGKEIYESVYNYDFEDWFTLDFWGLDNITHWMHLPSIEGIKGNQGKTSPNEEGEKL